MGFVNIMLPGGELHDLMNTTLHWLATSDVLYCRCSFPSGSFNVGHLGLS